MKIFDGCLLVSDVDGTLIDFGKISEYTINGIKRFIDNGGRFTFATGRCLDAVRDLLPMVPINAPLLLTNGVVLYDVENERVVRSVGIGDAEKEILLNIISKLDSDIGIELHSRDIIADLNITNEVEIHNKYEGLRPVDLTDEEIAKAEWSKLFFTFEDIKKREVLKKRLIDGGIAESQIMFTNAYLNDGIHNYLEVIPNGHDKGTGVLALADELGIKHEKVFGIGDYYNDIPLLKAVGCAGVVAGAPEDITCLADFVSCSAAEGAVGKFIDYIEERMLKE